MSNDSRNFRLYQESDVDSTMYESLYGPASFKRLPDNDSQYKADGYNLQERLIEYAGYFAPTSSVVNNEILGFPSFLQYPHDLGKNRRYHHFIVFNIYQGDSDSVALERRNQNQAFAAEQAQYGLFSSSSPIDRKEILRNAGLGGDQLQQYVDLLGGSAANTNGVTTDAINFELTTQVQEALEVITNQGFFAGIESVDLAGLVKGSISDVKNFFLSLGIDETGYQQELNRLGDQKATGISGKKLNRAKGEQNILLASRRFGYANVRSKDTVCLYMPLKIQFNDQLIYSEEDMGSMKIMLDSFAGQKGGINAIVEKAATGYLADGVGAISSVVKLEAPNVQAARNAGTRSVANPRREAMFRDVGLRTHSFTFEFAPKNQEEAQSVLNIIRMFRYHAYPALRGGGGHFFKFPAEFDAQFYTIDDASGSAMVNDNLPKLPRLALTNISVDYSAAGDYKTFYDAKPAFIRMELQFQEMEQLTNEHIIHGY